MSEHEQQRMGEDERLDRATADRLARLGSMPVDTSRLEQSIRALIPPPARRRQQGLFLWAKPMRAVAALLLMIGVVAAVLLYASGGPALASPAQMAQMHEDIVSGKTPVMQVSSVDEANRALTAQWPDSPGIPTMPADHVMACCMKSVKDKKVACVLLKNEGEPITMTIAKASDMSLPTSPTVERNGMTYHVQSFNALNMVMTERNGRWVCLIGKVPTERLMDLALKLHL
jgi:hypothetical protein